VERREPGELYESAMLVETIDGERRQTLQVLLSLLADGTWQLYLAERPGWEGRHSEARYATEEEARDVLAAIYEQTAERGVWHKSRFGHRPPSTAVTHGKPSW
jgi:hypothetical protein